uniref:Uncharacterized protein n=1 Tax=Arundo donax TaxID=35708 RepID=A0A0A9FMJ5_ARUDO
MGATNDVPKKINLLKLKNILSSSSLYLRTTSEAQRCTSLQSPPT